MKVNVIWKVFITLVLLLILGLVIILLKKVNRCCNCNENKYKKENVLILRTAEVYDSAHNKGTHVWIDTLSPGEQGNSSLTVWYYCPEKEKQVEKVSTTTKKSSVIKKIKEVTSEKVMPKVMPCVKEELVKKDTCPEIKTAPSVPDTLKVKVEKVTPKDTSLLYSHTAVLPMQFDGFRNKLQFNYDFVPDLHLQEYIKKAKKHLWIGTTLASAGAIAYASTMFCEIPTFVEYNGLDPFNPLNKYYDRNVLQREHLNTLKWVRGTSVAVGVLGGVEIIHGIILLKNADLSIAPQRITLRYSF